MGCSSPSVTYQLSYYPWEEPRRSRSTGRGEPSRGPRLNHHELTREMGRRTFRYAFFGASMGPLAGAWNKYLEVTFPLRPVGRPSPVKVTEVPGGEEKNPLPGLKIPKGAKLERGQFTGGGNVRGANAAMKGQSGKAAATDADVSVMALVKRVAADQLGM
jgi:hypothetical protein